MDIHGLLHPSSIAIIGASREPQKLGHIVTKNILESGFTGDVYPINPNADEILGLRAYASLTDLQQSVDLAIIALPATFVLDVLQECIDTGCTHVIVFTAGFKEIGDEGAVIEEQIQLLAKEHDITLLGPNCLGYFHAPAHINATFSQVPSRAGNLKVVSQSGAIASALFDRAESTYVGIETCVTLGNTAVLDESAMLAYRSGQAESTGGPMVLYLEQIHDGKTFMDCARILTKQQPVILLKPGKSQAAQQAMQSHTGSLAGSHKVITAACKQAGVIYVDTMQELFDLSMYLSWEHGLSGNRVAVISNAGGPAVITSDLLIDAGLALAELNNSTKQKLAEHLPRAASLKNPIDVLGDAPAERYSNAIQEVIDNQAEVDVLLVLLTPQVTTQIEETAKIISALREQHQMPIVCAFVGQHDVQAGLRILREHHIPAYQYPSQAVQVLGMTWSREQGRKDAGTEKGVTDKTVDHTSGSQKRLLGMYETKELLEKYNIAMPAFDIVTTIDEAKYFVQEYEYPVVMKLTGPSLLHKIDIGGIITNISSEELLQQGFDELTKAQKTLKKKGIASDILIQQQIVGGVECIVGSHTDSTFGQLLLFGPGGTLTELFDEHQIAVLPTERAYIQTMVESSPVFPLLSGYRGTSHKDIDGLLDLLEGFVQLVENESYLAGIEINPIIITEKGVYAVDPKLLIQ